MASKILKRIMFSVFIIFCLPASAMLLDSMETTQREDFGFSRNSLCDEENQQLNDGAICQYLTKSETCIFRVLRQTITAKIESHFRNQPTLTKAQLQAIVWHALKSVSLRTGTSIVLLSSYLGLNIVYSWGVEQIPYPALSSTFYTFQTIINIAVGAPILTPLISSLTKKAFNFRQLEQSTAIETKALEELWYLTNNQLSMNAEMSRNVVFYFLLFLEKHKNSIELQIRTARDNADDNQELRRNVARQLAIFAFYSKLLFPELPFDSELIAIEIANFINDVKSLAPVLDKNLLFQAIREEMNVLNHQSQNADKFSNHIQILENYWSSL